MTTAAPISPVSPVQIPCKLVLDYAFEEDSFPFCGIECFPATPVTATPRARAVEKRTRTNDLPDVCSSPRKRQATKTKQRPRGVKNLDRRVRFTHECKQFDGLKPLSEALELVVWQFYTVQNIQSADDILSLFKSRPHFQTVFEQVGSAINRLAELLEKSCADATVPVLPRGGGRGLLLGSAHIPTFKQLRDMFASALKRVKT